ncbi:MAG: prenyltransferase/squalene oxidase repeat-containing protein [Pirellula sp.]|jgi:geranylgeranyl transferase type-2 subunit beta
MEFGYLERLTIQLTAGAALLDDSLVKPHLDFVLRSQNQDGGWGGREGDSDLYYTSFALRSLAILGSLTGEVADRAGQFLLRKTQSQESIIDLLSLVYGAALIEAATETNPLHGNRDVWQSRMQSMLHQLRRSDGGFARTLEANVGSTYQTFLVAICLELMGYSLPVDDPCVDFLLAQRRADGGFLEVRVAKRSGTNPTAAAIGALRTLEALNQEVTEMAADFLVNIQTDEGGYQANTRMPLPDLLSTFTASVTLWDLGFLEESDIESAFRYGLSMARPTGGFAGFELDPAEDIEYTFYGLGLLSLLKPWVN